MWARNKRNGMKEGYKNINSKILFFKKAANIYGKMVIFVKSGLG